MVIQEIFSSEKFRKIVKKYNQKIEIVLKLSVSLETIKKRILERKILKIDQMISRNSN